MSQTDDLNTFIKTGKVPQKTPHWFNRAEQKKHIFELAIRLYVDYEYGAEEAMAKAEEFVDAFFERYIAPGAKK